MDTKSLGWDVFFESRIQGIEMEGCSPARVIEVHRGEYRIAGDFGAFAAGVSRELRRRAQDAGELPAVGDWVIARLPRTGSRAIIRDVLPRRTKFSRKTAGQKTSEQVVAANIDVAFIVSSLNQDFNLRRLERYLLVAGSSGADSVVLLNKADLCADPDARSLEAASVAGKAPVHLLSAKSGAGIDSIRSYCSAGRTAVFLGSSGVGKSTLINHLMGKEIQLVQEVREEDDRGRHTTVSGRMLFLPTGGMVIDTPGMRELQMWDAEGFEKAFDDVTALADRCRFRDCRHEIEPGCAVRQAVDAGTLEPSRLLNYQKLQQELANTAKKQDALASLNEKKRIIRLQREYNWRIRKQEGE